MAIMERFKNAFSAFMGRDAPPPLYYGSQFGGGYRPDRIRYIGGSASSEVAIVHNRIAIDCSKMDIKHVRVNEDGRYEETINDSLNEALTRNANVDQTGRELIRDAITSMFQEGCVAIVPVLTDIDPITSEAYNIYKLRVGRIVSWYPEHIKVECYDERIGQKKIITQAKKNVAIVQNPFYDIMNEPNSTLQRLLRVLNQLDAINGETVSGKANIIVQLPYITKTEVKKQQAEERRKSIEEQLDSTNKNGIVYIDGTEKIIQLNRSLENNFLQQAQELREQLYGQLGLCKEIFNGTANEQMMLNYTNNTLEPVLTTLTEEMERKWLSRTAISQGQAIRYFTNLFKLVPAKDLAEIADKFTRNEIASSNEFRSILGYKPDKDPKADMLINSNLNHPEEEMAERESMADEEGNDEDYE